MTKENHPVSNGLVQALQQSLAGIGSQLIVRGLDAGGVTPAPEGALNLFPDYACVRSPWRRCEVSLGGRGRAVIFDFWERGVYMADGKSWSLTDVARSIHSWVADKMRIAHMEERYLFFKATSHAKTFEQGKEVEASWTELRCRARVPDELRLESFIELAWSHPSLRVLFPYTNYFALCFSRCTGYPYSGDCPAVVPTVEGRFAVLNPRGSLLGEGSAAEALDLVVRNLPANCGPAVKGTAEDLKR
jgi:hypothetical protein